MQSARHALLVLEPLRMVVPPGPYPLRALHTVVGRDPDQANLVVEDSATSRAHLEVVYHAQEQRFRLTDLGSSNGTFVNAKRVRDRWLEPNDVIRAGNRLYLFLVQRAGLEEDAVPPACVVEGTSEAAGEANRLLGRVARSGRCLVVSEPGIKVAGMFPRLFQAMGVEQGTQLTLYASFFERPGWARELYGTRTEPGLLARATSSCLVLVQVHFVPRAVQDELSFLLSSRAFRPEGADAMQPFPAPVIGTTTLRPGDLTGPGGVVPSLLAELAKPQVHVKPLRERRQDVAVILFDALRELAPGTQYSLSPEFLESLLLHPWPSNVSEVIGVAEAIVARPDPGRPLEVADLPSGFLADRSGRAGNADGTAFTEQTVAQLLKLHGGNVTAVAEDLRVSRRHLYRVLEMMGLDPERFRPNATSEAQADGHEQT
jgi:hypothetical protein